MKIWLDTDPGVDDALAMALIADLCARQAWQWVGVSTVFGNVPVAQTTDNALRLLTRLGCAAVPVHAGAAGPLAGSPRFAPDVHGVDGLGGNALHLPAAAAVAHAMPAAAALVAASQAHEELHVIAVGPFTNLALALRQDPAFAQRVASLTVMGGAFGQHGQYGNVTPAAEANVFNDAAAASEVFNARWRRLRVVGLDATHCVRLLPETVATLPPWLHRMVAPYMRFYGEYYGADMLVAHDATAVASVLVPDAMRWRQGALRVLQGGWAHGQTLQDWQRLGDADWRALPAHEVAVAADPDIIGSLCLRAWLHFPENQA